MSRYTDFQPKWARGKTDIRDIDASLFIGNAAPDSPSLTTRLIPMNAKHTVSSKTLCDIVRLTQRIMHFAAYDVVKGIRKSFSDLRTLDSRLDKFAQLQFSPSEFGSYVIPGELSTDIYVDDTSEFTTGQVLNRFAESMTQVGKVDAEEDANVSDGMLAAIVELGVVLRRDTEAIEFTPWQPQDFRAPAIEVNQQYVARAKTIVDYRKETSYQKQDELVGRLVGLNMLDETFVLTQDDEAGNTIQINGRFASLLRDTLVDQLMQLVKVRGIVTYSGGHPSSIKLFEIEPLF